jgi:hypothetical protein
VSRKVISKHWWKFFGFIIVLSLMNMAGMLVFVVGFLVTAPVALAALMCAYEDIFGAAKKPADIPSPVPPVAATGMSSGWKIATALLAVVTGMILLFAFMAHEKAHVKPPPPKVVSLTPANGAIDVDPGLTEIQVMFDQPMHNSWSMVGGGSQFPDLAGQSHYDAAGTTWIVPVQLKPGWTYKFGLNSKNHANFKSEQGVPLEPVRVTFRTAGQAIPIIAATDLVGSDAFGNLLNEDQRRVVQSTGRQFRGLLDTRTFDGWSNKERAALERRMIDTLKGPLSDEYYQAISTLAALRSINALPALREMAFDRRERNNRDRWMAVRALGIIGDRPVVPEMIHLLYHRNLDTRWWAQISLVRLTGRNFGKDWEAWGNWWNSQNGQPPFNPEIIRWWSGQVESDKLAHSLDEIDRRHFQHLSNQQPE